MRASRRRALPVVDHVDLQRAAGLAHLDARRRGVGVLERVGERLLHDPVADRSTLEGSGSGPRSTDSSTARPAARTRSARASRFSSPGASEAVRLRAGQQAAQLGQRLAAGGLDRAQRLAHLRRPAVERISRGRGLDRHHAHAVADDVVQLPRHPRLLLGGGPLHVGPMLGLEPARALAPPAAGCRPAATRRRSRRGLRPSPRRRGRCRRAAAAGARRRSRRPRSARRAGRRGRRRCRPRPAGRATGSCRRRCRRRARRQA